jgi:DNA-binding XRE family transcriptional regulator
MVGLKEARIRNFFSVRGLAKAAGVSQRTIVEAEAGRRLPHFAVAKKIAAALGMEPGEIDEFVARVEIELAGKDAA